MRQVLPRICAPDVRQQLISAQGLLRSLVIYHNPATMRRWARFYRGLLRRGDLAFDVGAHVGTRARTMRAAGAKVVALEPQRPFSTFLARTMPRDITVLDMAVGRAAGEADMAVSSRHPTVSSLASDFVEEAPQATGFEHVRWDRRQAVRVTTLDTLIARYGSPRYIKIDVEGHEEEVLGGLSVPVDIISVEYLPAYPALALGLVERLRAMGNDAFNVVSGETGRFLWEGWRDAEAARDWLCRQETSAPSGDLFARRSAPEAPLR